MRHVHAWRVVLALQEEVDERGGLADTTMPLSEHQCRDLLAVSSIDEPGVMLDLWLHALAVTSADTLPHDRARVGVAVRLIVAPVLERGERAGEGRAVDRARRLEEARGDVRGRMDLGSAEGDTRAQRRGTEGERRGRGDEEDQERHAAATIRQS